jgi:hypothetical protein
MKNSLLLGVVVLLVAGCASVANPFTRQEPNFKGLPEESLRAAAHEIEGIVLRGDREANAASREGLSLDSPRIQQAVRTRAARSELVKQLLASGFVYEQRGGLIAIMRSKEYKAATTSRDRDRNALVVLSENQDRWALYEGILEANNFGARNLSAVQSAFAAARRDLLPSGSLYEDDAGAIVAK